LTLRLVDRSLELAPLHELGNVTDSLERTGREYYKQAREQLRKDAAEGRVQPQPAPEDALAPEDTEAWANEGEDGSELRYYVRRDGKALDYSTQLRVPMKQLEGELAQARQALELPVARDVRGGFSRVLILITGALWLAALTGLVFLAARISKPVRQLTQGLG